MPKTESVMVVTDVFPPVAAVGVYRTVALCKCLVEAGVGVTVISARPRPDQALDPATVAWVPPAVRIIRAANPDIPVIAARLIKGKRRSRSESVTRPDVASGEPSAQPKRGRLKTAVDWMSWWMHIPDTLTGWFVPGVLAGLREAWRRAPDVIFCTAPAWTSLLVGAALAKLLRVPLVADFQDPWCGSFWKRVPYRAQRRCDEALERLVVRSAEKVTAAWDGIRKHLAGRYPDRAADFLTILNGFDPAEVEGLTPVRIDAGRCVLLHAGTFYGPRSPIPLLEALRRLAAQYPREAPAVLAVLLGRSEYGGRPLQDLVEQYGAADLVRVIPLVQRRESLAMMKGADACLLFGQSGYEELASVPAKAYDYISLGSPVLAIGGGAEVCEVMRRGGCRVWAAKDTEPDAIVAAIRQMLEAHRQGLLGPRPAPERLALAWRHSASQLAGVVRPKAEKEPADRL